MSQPRAHWSGRFAFILAAAGSAVGLGNIWKFPYITGENGGGAFVLIYLGCILLVGLPLFIAELYLGQKSQSNAIDAFNKLDKPKSPWRVVGLAGVLSAFLIMSFYSVVGGWVLEFLMLSITGGLTDSNNVSEQFGNLLGSAGLQLKWHFIFLAISVGIVIMGVKDGLERFNKIFMPLLFAILLLLLVKSFSLSGFGQAMSFLFSFDFSKVTGATIIEAVGHSFFTLSLGMGAILTYGSYLSQKESLVKTSIIIGFLDTFIALMAGVIIFSTVFSEGLPPEAGPGLMFKTLPTIFNNMEGGQLFSIAFFLLVTFAALSSAVSLLEVVIAYWTDQKGMSRPVVALVVGAIIGSLGILCALSFNHLSDFKIVGYNFFDLFDKLTANILMPAGGLGTSLFFGWKIGQEGAARVFPKSEGLQKALLVTTRYLAPLGIVLIWLNILVGS